MRSRIPQRIVYLFVFIIPFWLIFFNSPFGHKVKMNMTGVLTSSVSVVRWPLNEFVKILSYRKIWKENGRLREKSGELSARVIRLEEIIREDGRLDRLSRFRVAQKLDAITAVVIARDPSDWNSSLMIDKGAVDGLRPGMPVVNVDGVVGKVAEVSQRVSKVILVSDPGFSVSAVNRRSRESGLVSGTLSGNCRMRYLPDGANIEANDEIVTSPLSADFPPGLLIGRVIHPSVFEPGGEWRVEIMPVVDVSTIEEVLVIRA